MVKQLHVAAAQNNRYVCECVAASTLLALVCIGQWLSKWTTILSPPEQALW